MTAFHLLAGLYLLGCAAIGVCVGKALGANLVLAALGGALCGVTLAEGARRALGSSLFSRPGCSRCGGKEFKLLALRLETHSRTVEGEAVDLHEDGFLYQCGCGRLYFQTPHRFGRSTRLMAEAEDGVLRNYMRASPILGRWQPDPEPDPPRSPYRS